MAEFGRRKGGGRRGAARERVLVEAALLTMKRSHAVLITDISTIGAKLEGGALPQLGENIWLKVGRVDVLASVSWVHKACGVHFDEPLTAEQLTYMRQEGRGTTVSKLAMEDWQSGLAR